MQDGPWANFLIIMFFHYFSNWMPLYKFQWNLASHFIEKIKDIWNSFIFYPKSVNLHGSETIVSIILFIINSEDISLPIKSPYNHLCSGAHSLPSTLCFLKGFFLLNLQHSSLIEYYNMQISYSDSHFKIKQPNTHLLQDIYFLFSHSCPKFLSPLTTPNPTVSKTTNNLCVCQITNTFLCSFYTICLTMLYLNLLFFVSCLFLFFLSSFAHSTICYLSSPIPPPFSLSFLILYLTTDWWNFS